VAFNTGKEKRFQGATKAYFITVMERLGKILHSFRFRVTLAFTLTLFFVITLSSLFIYKFGIDEQLNQIRERLKVIAQTASLVLDGDMLMRIPLERAGIDSPAYKVINQKLTEIKRLNPTLKYVYTLARTDKPDTLRFIVDPDPILKEKGAGGPTAFPGDEYYAGRFPEMLAGFKGPTVDKNICVDEWGVTLSGYAPIRDISGKVVAIIGVDMSAQDIYNTQRQLKLRGILVLIAGLLASLLMGILVSRRVTDRIERIVEGTRHIAQDDLDYKVEVRGHDEITDLAGSFNTMASTLAESKQKLRDYFFRVVQSLVRILEVKDHYTRGHSDRVAEYAWQIGVAMGFSQEKVETLKKAAQLHDIGKLVIHENILNKPGKLTDEEWRVIKEHPIVAEDVLRPILIDKDVLAMVRSHHERYDGKGYPDQIKGDNINIFAQIVSVADSYDAMTSPRAYRPSMGKDVAIQELKNNCGTQFNTQVVQAFLRALEEKT
jgi:response regulator RpfG family c-di-GMP phosphodiesterase